MTFSDLLPFSSFLSLQMMENFNILETLSSLPLVVKCHILKMFFRIIINSTRIAVQENRQQINEIMGALVTLSEQLKNIFTGLEMQVHKLRLFHKFLFEN